MTINLDYHLFSKGIGAMRLLTLPVCQKGPNVNRKKFADTATLARH